MKRLVPLGESEFEVKILSSRFVAILFPIEVVGDFLSHYEEIKHSYPKADHYPYAYVLSTNQKCSDDGEPTGSAGRPVLSLLRRTGIEKGALVIVRYFGGSKLGAARLARTFFSSAEGAIKKARFGEIVRLHEVYLSTDYHGYEEVKRLAERNGYQLSDVVFGELVNLTLRGDDTIISALSSLHYEEESLTDLGFVEVIKEN